MQLILSSIYLVALPAITECNHLEKKYYPFETKERDNGKNADKRKYPSTEKILSCTGQRQQGFKAPHLHSPSQQ
jgi:hypothetical protein